MYSLAFPFYLGTDSAESYTNEENNVIVRYVRMILVVWLPECPRYGRWVVAP